MDQRHLIKSHMQVISADGRLVGYVERLTEAEIITSKPCRHIPLNSIRRVTDEVYIGCRASELEEYSMLTGINGH